MIREYFYISLAYIRDKQFGVIKSSVRLKNPVIKNLVVTILNKQLIIDCPTVELPYFCWFQMKHSKYNFFLI